MDATKRRIIAGFFPALGILILGPSALLSQTTEREVTITPRATAKMRAQAPPAIRADVGLVTIPITVTNQIGAPVSGLPANTFHLFENGREQHVRYFSMQEGPVSLGVIFDASTSMEGRMDQSRSAMSKFFDTALPGDEYFLVAFNDSPKLMCDFTSNPDEIERAVRGITPKNWTALFDAVYIGLHQMRGAQNPRRALLVLSDGGDNNSRYTESEMKRFVREADVSIYTIGIASGFLNRHSRLLRQLSDETGGQYYQVDKITDLPEAISKVSDAIRLQYVLGYLPTNASRDGQYRRVEVRLDQAPGAPRLRASWRTGYFGN